MHLCECGHKPASHYGDTGACEHIGFGSDGMSWFYDCQCPRYIRDDYDEDR